MAQGPNQEPTEIPPKNDDSETQGDATGIVKTICASDEGENKGPIINLITILW